jgi:hypothetical protein
MDDHPRHAEHLALDEYSRDLPEKCHLKLDLSRKNARGEIVPTYAVMQLFDDGKVREIHAIRQTDVLSWKDRTRTFGFAARHGQRAYRLSQKKES